MRKPFEVDLDRIRVDEFWAVKPACPFCRGTKLHLVHDIVQYYVECCRCLASGPSNRTKLAAVRAWTRVSVLVARAKGEAKNG